MKNLVAILGFHNSWIYLTKRKANYASTIYIRTISAFERMIAATLIITQDSTI